MFPLGSFEQHVESAFVAERGAVTRRIARRSNVYTVGSRDDSVYFVVAGLVKVITQSPAGRECLLAIYSKGDLFGECCFSGEPRSETAIAMKETILKSIASSRFLARMAEVECVGDFVACLAQRMADQQQVITNLATVDCEYRLGAALLRLARKLGSCNPGGLGHKISHQELSQMVGTTRPRISEFMQRFRKRGLIDIAPDSRILVNEQPLRQYLEARGCPDGEAEPVWGEHLALAHAR